MPHTPFAIAIESRPSIEMRKNLDFKILPQPTETTCGPTCLHGVYRYFGKLVPLPEIIRSIHHLEDGGTLAVMLGRDALKRGFRAKIYTYNLDMFDPTWFAGPQENLREFLRAQQKVKHQKKLQLATDAYVEFLELGGQILFEDLTPALLHRYMKNNIPILTGLSATHLYKTARENGKTNKTDPLGGEPAGHFVVIGGYDPRKKQLLVADPFHQNPFGAGNYYWIESHRVISSILLGIVTYDANLLIIEPPLNRDKTSSSKSSISRSKTNSPHKTKKRKKPRLNPR